MKTITKFETPEEFLRALSNVRAEGDESPTIPRTVYLVAGDHALILAGQGSDLFNLGDAITRDSLFEAALKQAGISKVEIVKPGSNHIGRSSGVEMPFMSPFKS